jgi:hypothetical protein
MGAFDFAVWNSGNTTEYVTVQPNRSRFREIPLGDRGDGALRLSLESEIEWEFDHELTDAEYTLIRNNIDGVNGNGWLILRTVNMAGQFVKLRGYATLAGRVFGDLSLSTTRQWGGVRLLVSHAVPWA